MKSHLHKIILSLAIFLAAVAGYQYTSKKTQDRNYGCQGNERDRHIQHIEQYLNRLHGYKPLPWLLAGCTPEQLMEINNVSH